MSDLQTVDPEVSRVKFARELANYRSMESAFRKKGWFLLDAEFPEFFVVFAATKLRPSPIVAAVVLDFTNYDLQPPSVTFVDPFTREPIQAKSLLVQMLRRPGGLSPEAFATMAQQGVAQPSQMIQSDSLEDQPFICLPGVREYHDNPAHTGDSWLLHRNCGEGSLAFILEKIWAYGVNPLAHYQVLAQAPAINMALSLTAIPE
ncbi:hypothetical protein GWG65_30170 [Bradyrhizobium sp. CSA207]|uniref:putative metal-binding protein n=1 Tax=Bradyrhizobium sp. CSA207 TaxID=2698826 RepID=UPI0023B0D068|nr:putative metal-binding protein [Bradyrhizobium sp. CSA207]MDE5445604.1 hypothetical protein [Bradyrhizobium sp. CSA207]